MLRDHDSDSGVGGLKSDVICACPSCLLARLPSFSAASSLKCFVWLRVAASFRNHNAFWMGQLSSLRRAQVAANIRSVWIGARAKLQTLMAANLTNMRWLCARTRHLIWTCTHTIWIWHKSDIETSIGVSQKRCLQQPASFLLVGKPQIMPGFVTWVPKYDHHNFLRMDKRMQNKMLVQNM